MRHVYSKTREINELFVYSTTFSSVLHRRSLNSLMIFSGKSMVGRILRSMWEFEKNDSQRLYILMFSDQGMALFEKITRVGGVILLEVCHFQVCGMGFEVLKPMSNMVSLSL